MARGGVAFRGATLHAYELTSPGTSGQVLTSNGPGANPTFQDALLRNRTVLTDAQIKALPTTPVTLISAPGSGIRIRPIAWSLLADCSAGAYTNINTTYADVHLLIGTDYVGYGPVNDSTTTPALTLLSSLFGSATDRMFDSAIPPQQANGGYTQTINFFNRNQQENAALQIAIDNNGSGAFTGGHAANTLTVITYCVLETF